MNLAHSEGGWTASASKPPTTHVGLPYRADWLVSMVDAFLDAPTPATDEPGGPPAAA